MNCYTLLSMPFVFRQFSSVFPSQSLFFSVRVFFHEHSRLTGKQGKEGDYILFHSTTSMLTNIQTFATLHVRWLSHTFNRTACIYQTATRWDLPPYRIAIWLIDNMKLVFEVNFCPIVYIFSMIGIVMFHFVFLCFCFIEFGSFCVFNTSHSVMKCCGCGYVCVFWFYANVFIFVLKFSIAYESFFRFFLESRSCRINPLFKNITSFFSNVSWSTRVILLQGYGFVRDRNDLTDLITLAYFIDIDHLTGSFYYELLLGKLLLWMNSEMCFTKFLVLLSRRSRTVLLLNPVVFRQK